MFLVLYKQTLEQSEIWKGERNKSLNKVAKVDELPEDSLVSKQEWCFDK